MSAALHLMREGIMAEKTDHERLIELENRVGRLEEFIGHFKTAFGHLWAWLDKHIRGL